MGFAATALYLACIHTSVTITQSVITSYSIHYTKLYEAFVKFEGIDGESKDDGHKDWINLLSVTMTQDDSNVIQFTKTLDYSSAAISQSAVITSYSIHYTKLYEAFVWRS